MKYIWLVLFAVTTSVVTAQYSLQAEIEDQAGTKLTGATVVLLDSDSTLVSYGITNELGEILLKNLAAKDYIVQVSYISYAPYSQALSIQADTILPRIVLLESNTHIQEIEIRAEHIPIAVRGDTVQYNAAAYTTRPNALAKDLLRKLPGIEIDNNGTIKAQGKQIEHLYVNGKQFFGKDPKMATENLDAVAIDKVEVYDQASDMSDLTGISDGQQEKVINLKLKEAYTSDGFGRAELELGAKTYAGKLNYFNYSSRTQLSALASSNNINNSTYTLDDKIAMSGNAPVAALRDNHIDLNSTKQMDGLNHGATAGLNLFTDLNKALKLAAYYNYNVNKNTLDKNSLRSNQSSDISYTNTEERKSTLFQNNHEIFANIDYEPNSNVRINYSQRGHLKYNTEQASFNNILQNQQNQTKTKSEQASNQHTGALNSKLSMQRRLSKTGRSILAKFDYNWQNNRKQARLKQQSDMPSRIENIHQKQGFSSSLSALQFHTRYTEPLRKNIHLALHYKQGNTIEKPSKQFDEFIQQQWVRNQQLSQDFVKRHRQHSIEAQLMYRKKKLFINLGLQAQAARLIGQSQAETLTDKTYRQWLPSIQFRYELGTARNLETAYSTSMEIPTLEQMMPVVNNSNPAQIFTGNPVLKPARNHQLSCSYFFYDAFEFSNLWVHSQTNYIQNRVVNSMQIDSSLVQQIKPINAPSYYSSTLGLGYSKPIRSIGIVYDISSHARLASYDNIINAKTDKVTTFNTNISLSVRNKNQEKYSLETTVSMDYMLMQTQQFKHNKHHFNSYNMQLAAGVPLKSWYFASDMQYSFHLNPPAQQRSNVLLWNAAIHYKLLKNRLELRLRAHDILNQNIGFKQHGIGAETQRSSYNSIGRYIMFGISYQL